MSWKELEENKANAESTQRRAESVTSELLSSGTLTGIPVTKLMEGERENFFT